MLRLLFEKAKAKIRRKKNRFIAEVKNISVDKREFTKYYLSTILTFTAYLIVFQEYPIAVIAGIALVGNAILSKPMYRLVQSTATAIAA